MRSFVLSRVGRIFNHWISKILYPLSTLASTNCKILRRTFVVYHELDAVAAKAAEE